MLPGMSMTSLSPHHNLTETAMLLALCLLPDVLNAADDQRVTTAEQR